MKNITTFKRLFLQLCFLHFASIISLAQKPELVVQTGHAKEVNIIAFSPVGKLLASGGDDETVKLWDVETGLELRTLRAPSSAFGSGILAIAFSHDGKTLACAKGNQSVYFWDITTGKLEDSFEGGGFGTRSIAYSNDDQMLVTAGPELVIIKLGGGGILPFNIGDRSVVSVAFSPDSKLLASSYSDNTIGLWDAENRKEIRRLTEHSGEVESVTFSPDGKTVISGSLDKTIKVWEVSTGHVLRTLTGHSDRVSSVAVSPDGGQLLSGSYDGTAKLWSILSGQVIRTFSDTSAEAVSSVAFSGKNTLATGSLDKTIKLWNAATGERIRILGSHSSEIPTIAISPNGRTLASGSGDSSIELWDLFTGVGPHALEGHTDQVRSLAFSPGGNILASASWDETIRLWDITTGVTIRTLKANAPVTTVAFSKDGSILATGGADNADTVPITLWSVATGKELRKLRGHQDTIEGIDFSPDGKTLASRSKDNTIKLWNYSTGLLLRTLKAATRVRYSSYPGMRILNTNANAAAFSPNGKTLAAINGDNSINLWSVATGARIRTFKLEDDDFGGLNLVHSVTYSLDGKSLISGGDGEVIIWELATGNKYKTLKGHSSGISTLAFIPGRQILASGSRDATIKLWNIEEGKELASLIALNEPDWAVVAPDGLFDGSPGAWSKLIWRAPQNTFDFAPVEAYFSDFYYPGLLADIYAGKHLQTPTKIEDKDRRQPQVKVLPAEPLDGSDPRMKDQDRSHYYVHVAVVVTETHADKDNKQGSGAQDVRLFRNGSLVKVWRGDVLKGQTSVTLEATVPIVAGENKFTAYAFNHDNIKSNDAELTVTGADSLKRHGTAYILAIGVNNYANEQYNLKYAVADAEDFAAEVKRQQESLKRYAKVEVISLADAQATKANIEQNLSELAKQVQPEDAVIVFFAGHGTAQGNQFYLIPHDLGYDGPREPINKDGLQTILDHSISDRELEKLFETIDAGQLLLVIDACNSGQALEAEEKRRGPMNSKGLAQLAYEKGMYVLTAAQSYQAAQEAARFGHGFLTYALVEEGLKQGAADREPKNGSIDIREWLNFATDEVPKMQEQNSAEALRGRGRYVVFVGDGREVGVPKTEGDVRDNVQRPRVFYRREIENNPLIVGISAATAH